MHHSCCSCFRLTSNTVCSWYSGVVSLQRHNKLHSKQQCLHAVQVLPAQISAAFDVQDIAMCSDTLYLGPCFLLQSDKQRSLCLHWQCSLHQYQCSVPIRSLLRHQRMLHCSWYQTAVAVLYAKRCWVPYDPYFSVFTCFFCSVQGSRPALQSPGLCSPACSQGGYLCLFLTY